MDRKILRSLMKEHPPEVILDDSYIDEIIVPSLENYIEESKKNIETLIGIYKEQLVRIGPDHLCKHQQSCTNYINGCKACYEKVINKLEKILEEL